MDGRGIGGHNLRLPRSIDWNRVWRDLRAKRTSRKKDPAFWDGRAASFAKTTSETDYADRFLGIMEPKESWTVLDVGCGNGVLTIPLAKVVFSVTATDHAREMLSIVGDRCRKEGLGNVTTLLCRWEDDWEKAGVGSYDVAIASRSMVADDLKESILKLDAVARKRAYVSTIVGDGPYDRRLYEAIGRPLEVGPDYICNYNMLYQMGIHARVAFIDEVRNRTYDGPDEAFSAMRWMFDELTREEEKKLRSYLEKYLVFHSGSWRLCYDRIIRWAVMWWEKGDENPSCDETVILES
jgi:SAM-dependent methyltransferase